MTLEQKLSIALKSNNEDSINSIFEEIYSSYWKLVYFIIMQYINNKLDVEELTQDVFISFFNNLDNNNVKNIKYSGVFFISSNESLIIFTNWCFLVVSIFSIFKSSTYWFVSFAYLSTSFWLISPDRYKFLIINRISSSS